MNEEKATFGAGCFWGIEAAFRRLEGVKDTPVGYMGGATENPSYREVCTGRSGHAEVVQVIYDPSKVTYERLLELFWSVHDPTTPNRQGPDVGYQYRSVIFYHTPEQKSAAESSKDQMERSGHFKHKIVTAIEPAPTFWRAEEYHQRYFEKNPTRGCHL
jgi:peptide-methionine (S)-S-oxide reductase